MTEEERKAYKIEQARKTHLVEEIYKKQGIDTTKMNFPFGDLNTIVSIFGKREGDEQNEIFAKVYHPRKKSVSEHDVLKSCDGDKNKLADWLEDSSQRLKVLSFLIQKQADELRSIGTIKTTSYYTDADCNHKLVE